MRIQPGDEIVGLPALTVRKLMQYAQSGSGGTIKTIAEQLHIDDATAKNIFEALYAEKYIELDDVKDDNTWWHNTMKGNALANATARKPITRRTAERLIADFLKRVREINTCDDYMYRVKQVIIFGSYLSDGATLGDVDLSIMLEDLYNDASEREARRKERVNYALQEGRSFRSFTEMLIWPYEEVFKKLKNHSPTLSLHDEKTEQVLSRPIPSRILYEATSNE